MNNPQSTFCFITYNLDMETISPKTSLIIDERQPLRSNL